MLSSINDFLLRDNALTQVTLYSIPFVNVIVRCFHSIHSLDDFKHGIAFSLNDIDRFEAKKARFKNYLATALQIQIALAISGLMLLILFPPYEKATSVICSSFIAGASLFIISDLMLRFFVFNMTIIKLDDGKQMDITGY